MKKLLLILALIVTFGVAQSQSINSQYISLYADTTNLVGGDVFVRHVYGLLPTVSQESETVIFNYARVYYLNGDLFLFREESKTGAYLDEITIGATTYTFKQMYDLIVSINATYWEIGSWQMFLQFVN